MQSLRRIHLCNPACREPDTEPDHTGQQQATASESDKKTPPGVSQPVCVRQIEIKHIEYKHQNHRNRKDQQEKTFYVQKTFQCATGCAKSRTKSHFATAILRTEPKCADNTEKDIHQHKTDKSYFLLQIVYTAFQYNRTLFLQRDDTRYIQVITDSRSPIFSRKLSISSIRNPFLMRTRQSIF